MKQKGVSVSETTTAEEQPSGHREAENVVDLKEQVFEQLDKKIASKPEGSSEREELEDFKRQLTDSFGA